MHINSGAHMFSSFSLKNYIIGTDGATCNEDAMDRCKKTIPGPEGIFKYKDCEQNGRTTNCIYQCDQNTCNRKCIAYGNGYKAGMCVHDLWRKSATCLCK